MNEEALAELCRVVSLRCIEVDPECEGEQPGADGTARGLTCCAAQKSPAEPEQDSRLSSSEVRVIVSSHLAKFVFDPAAAPPSGIVM